MQLKKKKKFIRSNKMELRDQISEKVSGNLISVRQLKEIFEDNYSDFS